MCVRCGKKSFKFSIDHWIISIMCLCFNISRKNLSLNDVYLLPSSKQHREEKICSFSHSLYSFLQDEGGKATIDAHSPTCWLTTTFESGFAISGFLQFSFDNSLSTKPAYNVLYSHLFEEQPGIFERCTGNRKWNR